MFGKKGEVEWELSKIIIAVVVLVLLVAGVYFIYTGKFFGDGGIFASIKKALRFG